MSSLRVADESDLPLILGLRDHVEHWLAEKDAEQFQDADFAAKARANIRDLVEDRRFVILESETEKPLAVGALVPPDMDFWEPADDIHAAWYIGRLMVAEHGRDYGGQLIDLVSQAAGQDGRKYLRLDCWLSNKALHGYYESQGFVHLRSVKRNDRLSGALFERTVSALLPSPWDTRTYLEEPLCGSS